MKNITSFNCIAYVGRSLAKTVVTVDAKTTRIVQMLDIKEVGNV